MWLRGSKKEKEMGTSPVEREDHRATQSTCLGERASAGYSRAETSLELKGAGSMALVNGCPLVD